MAVETLRPSAAGDETSINMQIPDSGEHWDKVDEVGADDNTTRVRNKAVASYQRDLYSLPASSGSGSINYIKIHTRCKQAWAGYPGYAKPSLKSDSTVTDGDENALGDSWADYSQQWNANPADSQPWGSNWTVIDDLQIGVSLKCGGTDDTYDNVYCTQVYVEVNYTPFAVDSDISLGEVVTATRRVDYIRTAEFLR